jgi:copper resistance protein B
MLKEAKMIKKSLVFFIFLFGVSYAQNKNCDLYPIKPMEPIYYGKILFDRMELNIQGKDRLDYEITGWYGGDYNRLWIELEGEHSTAKKNGEIEKGDILYGKAISPFWDIRAGLGYTGFYGEKGNHRTMAVIGLKGLAPYLFEIDTNLRLTNKGELYGDFEAEYEILITQRLIVQPRIDTTFSFRKIEELGIGSGLNNVSISLRLRYELKREVAPYIGISWNQLFGQTKDIARSNGEPTSFTDIFLGLRFGF